MEQFLIMPKTKKHLNFLNPKNFSQISKILKMLLSAMMSRKKIEKDETEVQLFQIH